MDHSHGQIDEAALARLVALFYGRVRSDAELGPIFNDAIDDWPKHLAQLTDFWHAAMLASGRYHGNPMMKHLKHQMRIRPEHFDRWLQLWDQASAEIMAPEQAHALQAKARRIAESLKMGLWFRPEALDPKHRSQ